MAAAWLTNDSSVDFKIGSTSIPGLQSIPSLGGEPERVDITTLSDTQRHYLNGVKDYGELEFTFLYIPATTGTSSTPSNYSTAKTFVDGTEKTVTLTLRTGVSFTIKGTIQIGLNEAGINEAYTWTLTIGLTDDISDSSI